VDATDNDKRTSLLLYIIKAVFLLAKISAVTPVTATRDCSCLGHLGRCDTNRNDPISVVLPKVAKASSHVSRLQGLSPTNVANVN
jgi:hypothetical protein